jgi:hypothetical protein
MTSQVEIVYMTGFASAAVGVVTEPSNHMAQEGT